MQCSKTSHLLQSNNIFLKQSFSRIDIFIKGPNNKNNIIIMEKSMFRGNSAKYDGATSVSIKKTLRILLIIVYILMSVNGKATKHTLVLP